MAGLRWYEIIQKNKEKKRFYEYVFSKVDVVNLIHADLVRMTEEKGKSIGANFQFNRIFIGDIGTSSPIGRSAPYPFKGGAFKMIMAARFSTYQKRQDLLIYALDILGRSRDVHMTLFGEGKMKVRIQKMIEERGLHDKVAIRGFLPQEQLWAEMRKSDLLCHATEYEGLGKAIIESMALGLPVLVSNVAPLNAYIQDGENGFLVDNTPNAWADKIIELVDNKNKLKSVSRNSIEYIEKYYNSEKNVVTYEKEFMRLAAYK